MPLLAQESTKGKMSLKKKVENPKLKKLTLSRETLRILSEEQTLQAVGGASFTCSAETICNRNSCYC